ncbi:MAG: PACE efflux transporter [Pseudomonadaceae bacterium]|nr:PACE efflux transporter [Pseudomonadaceae bacterium]
MQGKQRKIVQALSYELLALVFIVPLAAWVFDSSLALSGLVAVVVSLLAMSWSLLFNSLFEAWEARQRRPQRTFKRRLLHALSFELGLLLFTVPVLAFGLDISWWQALLSDVALLLFFLVYALFFQWGFDLLFGPPAATLGTPS